MIEIEKESLQKINGNDVRKGNILFISGRCFHVLSTQHIKPGKGGAYMQVEMKDVQNGTKKNDRFRSAESVQKVFTESKTCVFLYNVKEHVMCMDNETFEEVPVLKSLFGENWVLLDEGMEVNLLYAGDTIVLAHLPKSVRIKIDSADAYIKGQTATSSYKPAFLECGLKVMVPQFVGSGEEIIINTEDLSYVSRAKDEK